MTDMPEQLPFGAVADDLRAAKQARRQRLGAPAAPAVPDAPAAEGPDVGPKLSAAQKATVIRVIAQYHAIAMVQQVLREDYPEIPSLTDSALRYYRLKVNADAYKDLEKARQEGAQRGLARREVRIANLARQADIIASRIENIPDSPMRAQYWREWREMLKQLAAETGQPLVIPPMPGAGQAAPPPIPDDPEEVYAALAALAEQRSATDAALAGSQRPPSEELAE